MSFRRKAFTLSGHGNGIRKCKLTKIAFLTVLNCKQFRFMRPFHYPFGWWIKKYEKECWLLRFRNCTIHWVCGKGIVRGSGVLLGGFGDCTSVHRVSYMFSSSMLSRSSPSLSAWCSQARTSRTISLELESAGHWFIPFRGKATYWNPCSQGGDLVMRFCVFTGNIASGADLVMRLRGDAPAGGRPRHHLLEPPHQSAYSMPFRISL